MTIAEFIDLVISPIAIGIAGALGYFFAARRRPDQINQNPLVVVGVGVAIAAILFAYKYYTREEEWKGSLLTETIREMPEEAMDQVVADNQLIIEELGVSAFIQYLVNGTPTPFEVDRGLTIVHVSGTDDTFSYEIEAKEINRPLTAQQVKRATAALCASSPLVPFYAAGGTVEQTYKRQRDGHILGVVVANEASCSAVK